MLTGSIMFDQDASIIFQQMTKADNICCDCHLRVKYQVISFGR